MTGVQTCCSSDLCIKPDKVHVLAAGRIVASGGPELAHQLEAEGYDRYVGEAA